MSEPLRSVPGNKLCFVIATERGFPPHIGGLALAAKRICGYLARTGFKIHVVTLSADGSEITTSQEDGLTVHRVPTANNWLAHPFALPHYLRKLDETQHFDLFHAFFLQSLPSCTSVARSGRTGEMRPVIASIRGSDLNIMLSSPYFRPLLLSALSQPHCWLTCVNQTYLDEVAQVVDLAGRQSVIRNGAPPANPRWQLSEENRGVVGITGEFRKVKDIPLLVRGFCMMRPILRRKLLLVGAFLEQQEEEWSMTLLREAGQTGNTEMTGLLPHSEIANQLLRMNVCVQTSAFEGMPNALLEAASLGVPIVATAVGGVKEIFTDGYDALLVPHAEPAALARAMERVIEDPDLARRLSANALKLCETFSEARERESWVDLHCRLLNRAAELVGEAS